MSGDRRFSSSSCGGVGFLDLKDRSVFKSIFRRKGREEVERRGGEGINEAKDLGEKDV